MRDLKERPEQLRNIRLKFHRLVRDRMIETQLVCMQTETSKRIVAIAVLDIATDRMTYISRVHTYLILTSRFQLELHQRIQLLAIQYTVMSDSQFSSIVYWTGISEISPVILEPTRYGPLIILHST